MPKVFGNTFTAVSLTPWTPLTSAVPPYCGGRSQSVILKHSGHRLPVESPACEGAFVQGPNEACWIVEVNKSQNGTYLEEGWEIFVQDTGLRKYDFLVWWEVGKDKLDV